MSDYIRKLVSGGKARFKDGNINIELDLVYVTDQVIIMGYPASGVEGLYRNRREDAKKFLDHRHGKDYWVFNFCPIKENSYPADVFGGRVSRYPFPDHHAPPLAIMPLVAREIHAWLNGSPDRVVVLHCKAGKGRSGTMACTYLLARDDDPNPPQLERSYSTKQWAKLRAQRLMETIPEDEGDANIQRMVDDVDEPPTTIPGAIQPTETPSEISSTNLPLSSKKSYKESLNGVLDLHTSRRMKPPSSPGDKVRHGVSIPSQRRWLYYWALILAHEAPAHLWPAISPKTPSPKVRLAEIRIRLREASSIKKGLVRAANVVMEYTSGKNANIAKLSKGKKGGQIWVSLARYDDDLVDLLERWELHTRDEAGHMGKRRKGSEDMNGSELSKVFEDGNWDSKKMVRSFARLGATRDRVETKDGDEKISTYTLRPLNDKTWSDLRDDLQPGDDSVELEESNIPKSESNSMYDVTQTLSSKGEKGVILDANREVRIKLYMGQVFMGWFWFIPTFHMPPPPQPNGHPAAEPTKLVLARKEIDFPLGIGSAIVDVEMPLEWVSEAEASKTTPALRQTSEDAVQEGDVEPVGITPAGLLLGKSVTQTIESKQAAKD